MPEIVALLNLFLILFCQYVNSSIQYSVPVFLWSNHQSTATNIPFIHSDTHSSSLVDQISANDLLYHYMKDNIPIVAFVQKDLSVEQFAANDAPYVSSIFDNSQLNPVNLYVVFYCFFCNLCLNLLGIFFQC